MEITDEQLNEITEWAKLYFPPKEICIALELDYEIMEVRFLDESDAIYKAYNKGVLLSEAEMRKRVIKLSNDGSSPAQIMRNEYRKKQIYGEQ